MTGEQDTGNSAWLPLKDRIARGFSLATQDRLRVDDIAQLEHPGKFSIHKVETWILRMETALEYGALRLSPGEIYDRYGGWPYVSRDAYRTWRATQPDTPAGSLIHLWLGAAPALSALTLPQGEPATLHQGEPDRPEPGAAESRKRKRVDSLAEAIEAALEVLSPDGRLPTPARLFEYLLTQDTTGVVIPGDSKTVFYWIASNGNKQSADFSTIAKRLDRMKQGD